MYLAAQADGFASDASAAWRRDAEPDTQLFAAAPITPQTVCQAWFCIRAQGQRASSERHCIDVSHACCLQGPVHVTAIRQPDHLQERARWWNTDMTFHSGLQASATAFSVLNPMHGLLQMLERQAADFDCVQLSSLIVQQKLLSHVGHLQKHMARPQ